jgi:hypothetical protein
MRLGLRDRRRSVDAAPPFDAAAPLDAATD